MCVHIRVNTEGGVCVYVCVYLAPFWAHHVSLNIPEISGTL